MLLKVRQLFVLKYERLYIFPRSIVTLCMLPQTHDSTPLFLTSSALQHPQIEARYQEAFSAVHAIVDAMHSSSAALVARLDQAYSHASAQASVLDVF